MRRLLPFVLVLFAVTGLQAQPLHPGLSGAPLRQALRASHSTAQVLSYDQARDTMYLRIDAGPGGTLTGVYTGYTITLTPGADPSTDAYRKGINAEHTWPQSRGATEGTRFHSDLHHLYPSRDLANAERGNNPFAEIPDAQTTSWWRNDTRQSARPTAEIDAWSESNGQVFEPREVHKGNVARSMFYAATLYEGQAQPGWLDLQKDVLLAWHRQDPPDSAELARTRAIARYQGNVNPFVVDTSLAARAWFAGDDDTPAPVAVGAGLYTFTGNSACPTTADTVQVQPAGAAFSAFERGGAVGCNTGANVFNTKGWPAVLDTTAWVGFTLAPAAGHVVGFATGDSLVFVARRSSTGPAEGEVRLYVDGRVYALGPWQLTSTSDRTVGFALPDLSGAGAVTVRFYAWGATSTSGTLRFDDVRLEHQVTLGTAREPRPELPAALRLSAAYPNPFNPSTQFTLALDHAGPVRVAVYDLLGREVRALHDGPLTAGEHRFRFDADGLPSGVYLIRATAGHAAHQRMVTLLK